MTITLVIPLFNEAETLAELLRAITAQTHAPQEVVFVDAGSTDATKDIVSLWIKTAPIPTKLISLTHSLPGNSRNVGINAATGDYVAFLDGGITPEPDWLMRLADCVARNASDHAFGLCRFDADTTLATAICALSSGVGTKLPAIPASLFSKSVFTEIGLFRSDLRAAEDTEWVARLLAKKHERMICPDALVHYRHFPKSISAIIAKWFTYARFMAKARVAKKQRSLYPAFFAFLAAVFFLNAKLGVSLLGLYLLIRGIALPLYKSPRHFWISRPQTLALTTLLALPMDLAKLFGFLLSVRQIHEPSSR